MHVKTREGQSVLTRMRRRTWLRVTSNSHDSSASATRRRRHLRMPGSGRRACTRRSLLSVASARAPLETTVSRTWCFRSLRFAHCASWIRPKRTIRWMSRPSRGSPWRICFNAWACWRWGDRYATMMILFRVRSARFHKARPMSKARRFVALIAGY